MTKNLHNFFKRKYYIVVELDATKNGNIIQDVLMLKNVDSFII